MTCGLQGQHCTALALMRSSPQTYRRRQLKPWTPSHNMSTRSVMVEVPGSRHSHDQPRHQDTPASWVVRYAQTAFDPMPWTRSPQRIPRIVETPTPPRPEQSAPRDRGSPSPCSPGNWLSERGRWSPRKVRAPSSLVMLIPSMNISPCPADLIRGRLARTIRPCELTYGRAN
jgi:hypothetical protein